jgi:hypothetical protein
LNEWYIGKIHSQARRLKGVPRALPSLHPDAQFLFLEHLSHSFCSSKQVCAPFTQIASGCGMGMS